MRSTTTYRLGAMAAWSLSETNKGNFIGRDPEGKPYILGAMPRLVAIDILRCLAKEREMREALNG
jgi:hypothetical protein